MVQGINNKDPQFSHIQINGQDTRHKVNGVDEIKQRMSKGDSGKQTLSSDMIGKYSVTSIPDIDYLAERIFKYVSTNYGVIQANNFRAAFLSGSDEAGNLTDAGKTSMR